MKVYDNLHTNPEIAARVTELLARTGLRDYCAPTTGLPVHVHPPAGAPDLSAHAVHLFPDGFDDVTVDLDDPDRGSTRFVLIAGDCRCRSLYTGNWFAVEGRLSARLIYGHSGCNRGLIAGTIEAELVLEIGHLICSERMFVRLGYTEHDLLSQPERGVIDTLTDAPDVFLPQFIDPDCDAVDAFALMTAFLAGEPWRAHGPLSDRSPR